MDARTGFQRGFIIFSNEDPGYETGQKPSGHVKLEVREGRGKLHATVQNLRPGNGRFVYKLYLLRTGRDVVVPAYIGQLMPEPNKAELEWSFDPRNVGASGYGIEEFGNVVVLVEYADRPGDTIICPLAAYKNKKAEWRSGLRTAMLKRRMEALPVADIIHDNSENNVKPLINGGLFSEINEAEKPDDMVDAAEQNASGNTADLDTYGYAAGKWQMEMQPQPQITQMQLQEMPLQQQPQPIQEQLYPQIPPMQPQETQPLQQQSIPYQQNSPMHQEEQLNTQYQGNIGQVDTGCVYLNGNICGAFVNNGASAVNPCDACRMHHAQVHVAVPPTGDISQLKGEIERYFEESDPFHSKRSDYMWWKVTNPVNLNNMLYQCNIRSPLLFNPAVMMAHYKYRHLIIGIYQHREGQKQYVVCGVPGLHMVDRKPFGEMSRWVQAEGNRPRYGAFGYWLIYIDPDDGKILSMNQE